MDHEALTEAQRRELREELEREIARLERKMVGSRKDSQPVQLDQASVGRRPIPPHRFVISGHVPCITLGLDMAGPL